MFFGKEPSMELVLLKNDRSCTTVFCVKEHDAGLEWLASKDHHGHGKRERLGIRTVLFWL